MADTKEAAPQTEESATEETAATPEETRAEMEQEVEYSAEMLDYIQSRKGDLGLEESSEEPAEQEAQSAEEPEASAEEAEAEPEPTPEPASRAARRALAKEKKLRAEREAFAAEQDKWRSETEESRAALEAFEESKANAVIDPRAHLESLGLSEDDMMDLAREIYYRHMPEAATPAVQAEMAAIQRERRLKKLERQQQVEPEKHRAEEPQYTKEYIEYETAYRAGLNQFAVNVDPVEFPLAAEYAKEDFNDLVAGMFGAAVQHARSQSGQGGDLSPEECMRQVEEYLKRSNWSPKKAAVAAQAVAEQQSQSEPEPAPVPEKKKATLRNTTAAAVPNEKHEDDLSYEELKKRSQEKFYANLKEKQMIR